MRIRSCLLYGGGFLVVLVLCVVLGATAITGSRRKASFARLKARVAEVEAREIPARPAAEPEREPGGGEAPPAMAREAVFEAFGEALEQYKAWEGYEAADWVFELMSEKPSASWTDAEWARVREFLAANQGLIEGIRRIAAAGGPLVDIPRPLNFETPLTHLSATRGMARLLMLDAVDRAYAGDVDTMIRDADACLRLADAVEEDGILISSLVAVAMRGIVRRSMEGAIAPGDLSEEETRRLLAILPGDEVRLNFARALAGESIAGMDAFNRMGSGDPPSVIPGGSTPVMALYATLGRPLMDIDQAAYANAMEDMIRAAELPYYEGRVIAEDLEADLNAGLPFLRVMTRVLVPALTRTLESQARGQADMDLTRLGLAVELYHAETGQYPAALDDVAHYLGGAVPVDAYSGLPYVYRVGGGGFLLYSVGENLVDDGGWHARRGGDWVWRGTISE